MAACVARALHTPFLSMCIVSPWTEEKSSLPQYGHVVLLTDDMLVHKKKDCKIREKICGVHLRICYVSTDIGSTRTGYSDVGYSEPTGGIMIPILKGGNARQEAKRQRGTKKNWRHDPPIGGNLPAKDRLTTESVFQTYV